MFREDVTELEHEVFFPQELWYFILSDYFVIPLCDNYAQIYCENTETSTRENLLF